MTVYVCIAAAVLGGVLLGFGLGWSSRGSHEAERRGGNFLDPHARRR